MTYLPPFIQACISNVNIEEYFGVVGKKCNPNRKLTEMSRTGNLLLLTSPLILRCFAKTFSFIVYFYILETHSSLHIKLFNLPSRGTCANGNFTSPPLKFTSPPYQDNFVQGLDQRLK